MISRMHMGALTITVLGTAASRVVGEVAAAVEAVVLVMVLDVVVEL